MLLAGVCAVKPTAAGHRRRSILVVVILGPGTVRGDPALRLGVDRSTLYRWFRLATGLGISDYLAALRTKEACRLLKTTALPVAAIGKAVGLPTPTYFSRFFVRQTGLSPRSYRNIP